MKKEEVSNFTSKIQEKDGYCNITLAQIAWPRYDKTGGKDPIS